MVEIVNLIQEDIEEILKIEEESFKVPWKRNDFLETLEYDNIIFLVAKEDNKIIGYSGIYMSLDQADIANIAVTSLYRRKGIAQRLLDEMLSIAKEKGVKEVFLEVRQSNSNAINLYEKNGFKKIGIRKNYYTNPKEDALLMLKKL